MSRRLHQPHASSSRTSTRTSTNASTQHQLPAYELPFLPLTVDSCAKLGSLPRKDNGVSNYVSAALAALTSSAADLGERTSADVPASAAKSKQQELLNELELAARGAIDASAKVQSAKEIIGEIERVEKVSTETARRAKRVQDGGMESDEDEDGEHKPRQVDAQEGLWGRYKARMEEVGEAYAANDERSKYGQVHEYVEFRRTLWDAQNPNTPMPHLRSWFTSTSAPNNDDSGDESDELEVAQEKQSFKCPLTLREFEEPMATTKCPHVFEKSAIMDLFRRSGGHDVACPTAGCNEMLEKRKLKLDSYVLKKMQRMKKIEEKMKMKAAMREAEEEEEEEEEEDGEVEAKVDEEGDTVMEDAAVKVKKEKLRKNMRRMRGRVVDVDDEDQE